MKRQPGRCQLAAGGQGEMCPVAPGVPKAVARSGNANFSSNGHLLD